LARWVLLVNNAAGPPAKQTYSDFLETAVGKNMVRMALEKAHVSLKMPMKMLAMGSWKWVSRSPVLGSVALETKLALAPPVLVLGKLCQQMAFVELQVAARDPEAPR
jgi:hypothetical protein